MCLLWLKRGQMLLKRCKNLLQCQAGGITQLGKRKMWLGQKVAGDEAKLCPGEAEELRHLAEPLHCPQEVFALSQHISTSQLGPLGRAAAPQCYPGSW